MRGTGGGGLPPPGGGRALHREIRTKPSAQNRCCLHMTLPHDTGVTACEQSTATLQTGHNIVPGRCDVSTALTSSSPPLLGSSDTAAARFANASLCSLREDSSAAVLADCACAAASQHRKSVSESATPRHSLFMRSACANGHAAFVQHS
jgi:hypothetical protein